MKHSKVLTILVTILILIGCAKNEEIPRPVANAGPDQNVSAGQWVQLDGTQSYDTAGRTIFYNWSFESLPAGSYATLNNPEISNPSFMADIPGTYVIKLIVDNGINMSEPDFVTVTASGSLNNPPIADAGPDQNVSTGVTVVLDGSASSDPDGDIITYYWQFVSLPSGSFATLNNPSIVNPSFTADVDGTYILSLVVSDGTHTSSPDYVTVTASSVNVAPVANAGLDQFVITGSIINLDGSGSSDANGDLLTYSWSFVSIPTGSNAVLLNFTTPYPSFIADLSGTYVVQLIVNDGFYDSVPDTVTIIADEENVRPVADAGLDQDVITGSIVQLNGSGSTDANGDSLTYFWWFSSKPTGSMATLSDPTAVNPTFLADISGSYVVKLTVNDGILTSNADTVVITANTPPVADAGPDQAVYVADTVVLNGAGSFDNDGDNLSFYWSFDLIPNGSSVLLNNPNSVTPSFVPDVSGNYIIKLIVRDGKNQSIPDYVNIIVSDCNVLANPQGPLNPVYNGDTVVLDGSSSLSMCGRTITAYSWVMTNKPPGSSAVLSNPASVTPTFIADQVGTYGLQLIVTDEKGINSPPAQVWVDVSDCTPLANPQVPLNPVYNGDTVVMEGTGGFSPCGRIITQHFWTMTNKPPMSTSVLSDPYSPTPTFIADQPGSYEIELIVKDEKGIQSMPGSTWVNVSDCTPLANPQGPLNPVYNGDTVVLDGSSSLSMCGRTITAYSWVMTNKPPGSSAVLSNPASVTPTFIADQVGTYGLQLIVTDEKGINSPPAQVWVDVSDCTPLANPQVPLNPVYNGDTVVMEGTGGFSPCGRIITQHFWTMTNKPPMSTSVLSDPYSPTPTFIADQPGSYEIELIVKDEKGIQSMPGSTWVNVFDCTPVALAYGPGGISTGDIVTLDGAGSISPCGRLITYFWNFISLPPGSFATLNNPSIVNPSFTADVDGIYEINLVVTDSKGLNSLPYSITITASTTNVEPVADAGLDQYVLTGSIVYLDGTGSRDVNGDLLTYSWSFTSKPPGSSAVLLNDTSATPSFIADLSGTYVVQLIVNDGFYDSVPDTVTIIADEENVRPVADAGLDQDVITGSIVQLNGSGSTDANGDSLTYFWWFSSKPTGSMATLSDPTAVNPTFLADQDGSYVIKLTVNDGALTSDADTVVITASTPNNPPVANAGPDQFAVSGQTLVMLDGSASFDPDGDPITYEWGFISIPPGSTVTLNNSNIMNPTFTPDLDGEYILFLRVNDGQVNSIIDTVSVFSARECCINVFSGDGQSGTVNTVLPQPFVAQVTNIYGLPVANVSVGFSITAGNGSISSPGGTTDTSGQIDTTLTLGTIAGTNTVEATCATCTTNPTATFNATGVPDVPFRVVILNPSPSPIEVPGPMSISYQVLDQYGNVVDWDNATRFTITVSGSATFASNATQGTVISGGGTNTALIQVAAGLLTIDVTNFVAETVTFGAIDSEGNGLIYPTDYFENFDTNNGGFTSGGTNNNWQWGAPTSGPGSAYSPPNVWATNLSGNYLNNSNSWITSPVIHLSSAPAHTLTFRHWFNSEGYFDAGVVEISVNGGPFTIINPVGGYPACGLLYVSCGYSGNLGGYSLQTFDLSAYAGNNIQIRFHFYSDGSVVYPGWYIDNVSITGIAIDGRFF